MISFKLQVFVAIQLLVAIGEAKLNFINPSPAGLNKDYSADPIYTKGDSITIEWSGSESGVPLTLALLQQTLDVDTDASQEVIIESSIGGLTQYVWTVGTSKNLTASNVFFFDIFWNQSTSPDSTSHYFNITSSDDETSSTTSTSLATTATTTSALALSTSVTSVTSATSLSSAATTATAATAAATSSHAAVASGGLSTGAKIGIGVGIAAPVSLAIGAFVSWCFYKRRSKAGSGAAAGTPQTGTDGYEHYPGPDHQRMQSYTESQSAHFDGGLHSYTESKYNTSFQQLPTGQPVVYNPGHQTHFDGHGNDGMSNRGIPAQLDGHGIHRNPAPPGAQLELDSGSARTSRSAYELQ